MPLANAPAIPGLLQMGLGLYAYLLPLLIYVLWTTLALWDLSNRTDAGRWGVLRWTLAIYGLPFVGAALYLLTGARSVPGRLKATALAGALGVYLAVLGLGATLGGLS